MRYLKIKYFSKWARKEGISDALLKKAIIEFQQGLYEASLGHHLFKKRMLIHNRGKRSGARTILFYQQGEKIIFCFGFAKNAKESLDDRDKKGLHKLSTDLVNIKDKELDRLIQLGEFIEILNMEEER